MLQTHPNFAPGKSQRSRKCRLVRVLAVMLSVCILTGALAEKTVAQGLPPIVADELIRAEIPADAVAVLVQEVSGAAPVVAYNTEIPFHPASTMKLVTTYAALELLGPSYTWKTGAYASGQQAGDILLGDLVIKGSGDPRLVLENFWLFLRQIRASGIREIRGSLVLDRSAFEETVYDSALFDGEPLKPYNAAPNALLLNHKALRVRFLPDEAGRTVKVAFDPAVADYVVSAPRLGGGECGNWKKKLTASVDDGGARFDGEYALACGEQHWLLHPYPMTDTYYFAGLFRQMWRDLGGVFNGEVKGGKLPLGARPVAEWTSPPLAEVIRDINKYSNNVMARQLFLTMAAMTFNQPANPERGSQAIRNWLAGKGIPTTGMVIDNGSGLSRTERISAATLGRMLAAAFASPVMPELISSLPLAGYDGTMRKRLRETDVAGKAHIKTGAVKDVRALAGYLLAASGKRYLVVCMVNHANADRSRQAQDTLLEWIYRNG